MSVLPSKERLVLRSLVAHIRASLTDANWTNTSNWVFIGNLSVNPASRPPAVAVDISNTRGGSYELGNSNRQNRYSVEIEIWGKDKASLTDLKNYVEDSLSGLKVYNLNDVEVGSVSPMEEVTGRIVDNVDFTARVSCVLEEDYPIIIS